jgi:hypothetical protein
MAALCVLSGIVLLAVTSLAVVSLISVILMNSDLSKTYYYLGLEISCSVANV